MLVSYSRTINHFQYISTANSCNAQGELVSESFLENQDNPVFYRRSDGKIHPRERRNSYVVLVYEDKKEEILEKGKNLSRGKEGEVYEITSPSHQYVIKRLSDSKDNPLNSKKTQNEAEANQTIHGLGKFDICPVSRNHYILMNFIIGNTFADLSVSEAPTFSHFLRVCIHILNELDNLHKIFRKTHGDFHARNILLNNDLVKLVDFSCSSDIEKQSPADDLHTFARYTLTPRNFSSLFKAYAIPRQVEAHFEALRDDMTSPHRTSKEIIHAFYLLMQFAQDTQAGNANTSQSLRTIPSQGKR